MEKPNKIDIPQITGEVIQELNDGYMFYSICLTNKLAGFIQIIPQLNNKHENRYIFLN